MFPGDRWPRGFWSARGRLRPGGLARDAPGRSVQLSEVLGVPEVRIATEAEVERIFADCEPGALPPFGRLYGLTTVLDLSLALGAEVTFVANMRHEGVRMRFVDYEAIEAPIEARFSVEVAARSDDQRIAG